MKIKVRDEESELLLTTISVAHNKSHPLNLYLFRCPHCASPVAQVNGDIKRIFPGASPRSDVAVISKCGVCHELYTFTTQDYLSDVIYTRVTLSTKPGVNTFHCWICRNPQLQYNIHMVALLPSFREVMLPYKVDCLNKNCPAKYDIQDVI